MKRYCLALDLKNDPVLISEYEDWHQKVWPDIKESIGAAGIIDMEIYRLNERLFMIMETTDSFSFEEKKKMDEANPKVREWEALMWKFQEPFPNAKPGEKWMLMKRIFSLSR